MTRRILLALLVLALLGAGGFWYAGKPGGEGRSATAASPGGGARGVPVVTRAAEVKPMPDRISTIGAVQPIAAIAIKARVDTVVEAVHFTEGQEVKAGDPLFTLDSRALEAQLRQAQANLERDRANLDKARNDMRRYAELLRTNAVSRTQYDTAVAAAEALEGTVKADLAAVEAAKVSLSFTRIAAPMDGRTGAINARPGSMVRAADATPLVTLTQLRPIMVSFNVPERHLPAIREAMRQGAPLVTAGIPGDRGTAPAEGKLTFVDSQVEQQSGTIQVKGEFPNADTRLWPGQFVDVVLTLRVDPQAVTVPDTAVQTGQQGRFVYVVKPDDTVEVRPVAVARTQDGTAVIAGGLKGGDRVVVDGQSRLYPGAKVAERGPDRSNPDKGPEKGPEKGQDKPSGDKSNAHPPNADGRPAEGGKKTEANAAAPGGAS
ncbi:efflux RND transporter periplasmic adaptor subunit [Azospirillum thermophilum]|uniref:Efflux RND transporter periplasmic adaptor subunit n=1 Tax=Azospirillum thermophilum TaxID=2202148 RepID=A0A2S2CRQ5_9PROT|nr:efflux RND transporter periplasmic adaptor subunit [Azospirillum thermophilum]AWK87203.1 efflux RND transporter periplasmic adaptor subunit [Azospirillum thermophilum]